MATLAANEPNETHKIQEELLDSLYKNYFTSCVTAFVISSVVLWELYPAKINHLFPWYLTMTVLLFSRLGLIAWYYRIKNRFSLKVNYYLFYFGSLFTAILWGLLGSILMPNDIVHQAFILIILSGVLGGSVQSLGADYQINILYLLVTLIPVLIWEYFQILEGNTIYIGILVLMAIYCFASAIIAYHNYSTLVKNIKLRFQNMAISSNLVVANNALEALNNSIKKTNKQTESFSQMSESLQKCATEGELINVFLNYVSEIFPDTSGAIYLLSNTGDILEFKKNWGTIPVEQKDISLVSCEAMKTGKTFISNGEASCSHIKSQLGLQVCLLLEVKGEIFGILNIQKKPNRTLSLQDEHLLLRLKDYISLALHNMKLKKELEKQATHDLLTELFNRKYLNEFLTLELIRAERLKQKLSIMMIDIDHFKKFNDNYGHEAGDAILHALGLLLKRIIRGSDIPCRYGGEEFIMVLTDTPIEVAQSRAELMMKEVKSLLVSFNDQLLKGITVSIGIAEFPKHGTTILGLIEAADQAMYQAKRTGRDRICLAS